MGSGMKFRVFMGVGSLIHLARQQQHFATDPAVAAPVAAAVHLK